MRKKEAEQLVNQKVTAWTSANGEYVGILEAVSGSPWRGAVRITGVLAPAVFWDRTRASIRRGFRIGETITVGNSSITPWDAETGKEGTTYLAALSAKVEQFKAWNTRPHCDPKDLAWLPGAIQDGEKAVALEKERLENDAKFSPIVQGTPCGEAAIDNLAQCGAYGAVWHRLRLLFPRIQRWQLDVWLARREGNIRRVIEAEDRWRVLRRPEGPQNKQEWEMLGVCALQTAGHPVMNASELYTWD